MEIFAATIVILLMVLGVACLAAALIFVLVAILKATGRKMKGY